MVFLDKQLEQNNGLLSKLRENYIENKSMFAKSAALQGDDPRFVSAVRTHRWGVFMCEAYSKMLMDIKADIMADEDK